MNITQQITALLIAGVVSTSVALANTETSATAQNDVLYKTVEIDGVDIFYREAGSPEDPTILLLHGFPTSSHMFRELIEDLKGDYHLVAPDYPGFGNSEQPPIEAFEYTFDNFAQIVEQFTEELELDSYSLYLMDYGAPVGFRLAVAHPERVDSLIIQNGNAYDEGLRDFWDPIKTYWHERSAANAEPLTGFITPAGVEWQYTHGVRNAETISPDNWNNDLRHLSRAGNPSIQLQLFYNYGTNPGHYPAWQAYFREHQPRTLIVWGKNDFIFPAEGAFPYQRDLSNVDFNLLDTGHFALEEDGDVIAAHIARFLSEETPGSEVAQKRSLRRAHR